MKTTTTTTSTGTRIELRCEICSGKFDVNAKIPKVLSCGHTVCAKCVERMRNKNLNRCPFDRKYLDFDDDKIAVNYYILSLVEQTGNAQVTLSVEEEELVLSPKPVVNHPGWKNTLNGFIYNDVLYSVETNGFIYCTNLISGEWWFMYHNQFFGNFFFCLPKENKMYLIDQSGSLYQICDKNYYVQIGKKNAWKNTLHMTIFKNKMYTIESPSKFYETNITNGKWKEIVIKKETDDEMSDIEQRLFKNVILLIANELSVIFTNKLGEVFQFKEESGETRLCKSNFNQNIECYNANSSHVYYLEKNKKILYRACIDEDSPSFMEQEVYIDFDMQKNGLHPIKIIADDSRIVIIDKNGDINVFRLTTKIADVVPFKTYQCLFMLRNCHLLNTCLINDGDLLLLDPVRLSLNKLNIIAGTEVIILHSNKFLFNIRNIFTSNSRIYFIEVTGNLYWFNEFDKKLTQIGNNSICKYINDFSVYKHFLLTIENDTIFKTNLNDGNFTEIKCKYCLNYEYFFADNTNVVFVTRDDQIAVLTFGSGTQKKDDSNEALQLKKSFVAKGLSKVGAITLFRGFLIYYNNDARTIEGINIEDKTHKVFTDNFPHVHMFISNNDFLACILREGAIYKLFC